MLVQIATIITKTKNKQTTTNFDIVGVRKKEVNYDKPRRVPCRGCQSLSRFLRDANKASGSRVSGKHNRLHRLEALNQMVDVLKAIREEQEINRLTVILNPTLSCYARGGTCDIP